MKVEERCYYQLEKMEPKSETEDMVTMTYVEVFRVWTWLDVFIYFLSLFMIYPKKQTEKETIVVYVKGSTGLVRKKSSEDYYYFSKYYYFPSLKEATGQVKDLARENLELKSRKEKFKGRIEELSLRSDVVVESKPGDISCLYCRENVTGVAIVCVSCGAYKHRDCAEEMGESCTTLGCDSNKGKGKSSVLA